MTFEEWWETLDPIVTDLSGPAEKGLCKRFYERGVKDATERAAGIADGYAAALSDPYSSFVGNDDYRKLCEEIAQKIREQK